jgi:hypothetical protein
VFFLSNYGFFLCFCLLLSIVYSFIVFIHVPGAAKNWQKNISEKIGKPFPVAAGFQIFGSPPLETSTIKGGGDVG